MWVSPDDLVIAAQRLTGLESDLAAANATAARSITSIAAAAQDEVSQSLASMFSTYGQQTQAAVAQHGITSTQQFAQGIASAANSYSSAEATNNALLDFLLYHLRGGLRTAEEFAELAQTDPLKFLTYLALLPVLVLLTPFVTAVGILFLIALIIGYLYFS